MPRSFIGYWQRITLEGLHSVYILSGTVSFFYRELVRAVLAVSSYANGNYNSILDTEKLCLI